MANFYMPTGGYIGNTPVGSAPSNITAEQNAATADKAAAQMNDLRTQTFSNLGGALRGELPPDVVNQIAQQAAEFGVASGMPGSEFAGYNGLRTLGLNSLSRMQHAEDSLTPHFFQPPTTVAPQGTHPTQTVTHPASGGSAPIMRGPSSSPERTNPETGVKTPDTKSLVGDFLSKYLPGGQGTSSGMAPMGSGTQPTNYSGAIPFFGSGVRASTAAPGFYAGSKEGFDNLSLEQLVDMGLIDPAFGVPEAESYPGSFVGDINDSGDYGDFGDYGGDYGGGYQDYGDYYG